jgi:hypothetical protein
MIGVSSAVKIKPAASMLKAKLHPEIGGRRFLRNVNYYVPENVVSHRRLPQPVYESVTWDRQSER